MPVIAVTGPPEGLTLPEMVKFNLDRLTAKRLEILEQIAALERLPPDTTGGVKLRIDSLEVELSKIQTRICDLEDISFELVELGQHVKRPVVDIDTFEELVRYFDDKEVRTKEGRIMEKVKLAAEQVINDWSQNTEFCDGSIDLVFLSPETVLTNEANDSEHSN